MAVGFKRKPIVSAVITAHNEGDEVRRTIESIRSSASVALETVLVDDGSTDGCCELNGEDRRVRLVRHEKRLGIAASRHEASLLAKGKVIAYFDGHQRTDGDSIDQCARLALARNSIVCPDVCDFDDEDRLHGAYFSHFPDRRVFTAEWKMRAPRGGLGRVSSLKAPAYFIPKSVYPLVHWPCELRGWGGSEAAVSLKAFFTGIDILHLCGPLIRHQFKKQFHYEVGWSEVWRNQAIIARICFEERTWYDYWLPHVFEANLSDDVKKELESSLIRAEQQEFAKLKVRHDDEFWTRLVFRNVPEVLR
jgi:glycosyltransferase involved in cell wall biosynthesis